MRLIMYQKKVIWMMNLAIEGTAGGDPSEKTFPSRYQIDYVRVYQK